MRSEARGGPQRTPTLPKPAPVLGNHLANLIHDLNCTQPTLPGSAITPGARVSTRIMALDYQSQWS
jgi:hypothetical protein